MRDLNKDFNNDFQAVLSLIHESQNRAFAKVNAELVMLYFNIGKIVSSKVKDGVWGERTVDALAKYIQSKIAGTSGGFNRRGLYRMKQFFELYAPGSDCYRLWLTSKKQIVSPPATQLQPIDNHHFNFLSEVLTQISWTHHLEIFSVAGKPDQQLYYLMMCIKEKWTKIELRRQIKTASFERTMLTNSKLSPLLTQLPQTFFKDPYVFEFLNLPDGFSEKDVEKALIINLQKFILEVGKDFAYMGNQYRLQVGNKDYYTDLLFYHRELQCLVLFELKIEEFAPEFLGKLNFYLEALDREIKRPNENPSIGILLCKGKDNEVVEYALARNTSPAIITEYETKLIDKKLLTDKLQQLAMIFDKNTACHY